MSEVLTNTGVKLWSESDYSELWLDVFDQIAGQGGKSNLRLIDEAIGKINESIDGYSLEYSSEEKRLYISKGDAKLPVSLIDSEGHVASKVDGSTVTIDKNGIVKIPIDSALSSTSANPVQNKVVTEKINEIESKVGANETAISTLNGDGEGSVKKAVSDGIAQVVAGAPEDFDTLKEMSDWINSHESSASAMNSQIQENKKNLSAHTSNTDIHVTTADKTKWNNVDNKLDKTGDASNTTVSFTTPSTRENLTTKEKLSISLGKISKWFGDLKTVAFSGSYNDLSNKPTIPSVGNGAVTITQNGTSKGSFTMNQSGNTTIELTDNNTTYGTGNTSTAGLTKLYTATGTATDGTMTQNAIKTALDGKANSSHTHANLDSIGSIGYYGSDSANTSGWYKVYSTTLTGYIDHVARLSLISGYSTIANGIINLHLRCDNSSKIGVARLSWENRQGFSVGDVIINTNGNTWTLYVKQSNSQYGRIKIRVLESMSTSSNWAMTLTSNTTKESSTPTATVTATDGATVNYANSAATAINASKVNNHTVNVDVDIATTSKAGIVKPDGKTITVDADGTIHGANTYILPKATTTVLGGVKPDNKTTFVDSNGVLSAKGGGATITPKPTVNPQIKNDDGKVIITWEDPTNTVIEGSTFSTWQGTKLVMKESGYPTSPTDGTLLVDNTTRDKYKTTGFTKTGLTNDKVYYFALFPYSTDGVYNYDSGNRLLGEPTELKIVTFASGTDAEIAKMIQAHYNNKIKISDYWAVGDTRSVSLSAMSATGVGESHRAQTVQFVIGGFDHDDLTTAINSHTKAAVTLLQKDCLMDASNASNPVNGSSNTENGYMNSSNTNSGGWKSCARRTWCNNVYFAALPTAWQNMVKTVNKKSGTGGGSSSGTEVTSDKIFLAAEIEVFGSRSYSVDGEGTQYQYYKNATANRYKMPKWGSGYVSNIWWERSPRSGDTAAFCRVNVDGNAGISYASSTLGVAPCLCI